MKMRDRNSLSRKALIGLLMTVCGPTLAVIVVGLTPVSLADKWGSLLGLGALLCVGLGALLSVLGIKETTKTPQIRGKYVAIAGLILAISVPVAWFLLYLLIM